MAAPAPGRVILHVGTPKTGTTYLQDVLCRNRDTLRRFGVRYPGDRAEAHFLAAMDLQGATVEEVGDPNLPYAWDRLAGEVARTPGTVVVSHELFAPMEPDRIERARDELGRAGELHIVCTARDLGRQLPAVWQEDLKNRHALGFGEFLDAVRTPDQGHWLGALFWRMQDVPEVLRRWSAGLPADRVHLVTVPPAGAARGLLWERFARVLGVPADAADCTSVEPNSSLSAAEAQLLRRINLALPPDVPWWAYERTVRRHFADALARRPCCPEPLTVPAEHQPWVAEQAKRIVAELDELGCRLVGDLDDLLPRPTEPGPDPDAVSDAELLETALAAVRALVQRHEIDITERVRQEPPTLRRRLGALGERSTAGRWALRLYRRVRHRTRR